MKSNLDDILFYIVVVIAVVSLVSLLVFSFPGSDSTAKIRLHHPTPGITCATVVSSNPAIFCWKD